MNRLAWMWLWWRFCGRRALVRDRWRVVLVLLGLALVTSLTLGVISASLKSIEAFSSVVGALTGREQLEVHSRNGLSLNAKELIPFAKDISSDYFVIPAIDRFSVIKGGRCDNALADLIGVDRIEARAAAQGTSFAFTITSGSSSSELFVAASFAERCGLALGAKIHLSIGEYIRSARIAGLIDDSRNQIASDLILVDIRTVQGWLNERGRFDYLILAPRIANASSDLLSSALATFNSRSSTNQELILVNEKARRDRGADLLGAFQANILIMVLLALVVCGLSIFNFAQSGVQSRRNEISTLHTLGVPTHWSVEFVILEALVLATLGGAIGAMLGSPIISATAELLRSSISGIYITMSAMQRPITLIDVLIVILVLQSICGLAAALPAFSARSIAPNLAARHIEVIEAPHLARWRNASIISVVLATLFIIWALYDHAVIYSHFAALLIVVAIGSAALPTLVFVVNLKRANTAQQLIARSAVLGSLQSFGIAVAVNSICVSLLVAFSLLISSFRQTLEQWTNHTLHADLYVRSQVPDDALRTARFTPEIAEAIRSLPGVRTIARFTTLSTMVNGTPVTLAGTDLHPYTDQFQIVSGALDREEFAAGKSILLSERAAQALNSRIGAVLMVHDFPLRIAAVYREFGSQDAFAVVDFELLNKIILQQGGHPNIRTVAVFLDDEAKSSEVQRQIQEKFPALRITKNQELKRNILAIFDQTFAVTELIRYLIIVLSIVASTICTLQMLRSRAREMRTLDILGASVATIRRSIIYEGIIMAVPALITGWIAGVGLALLLIYVINPLSFGWSINFRWHIAAFYIPALALLISIALSCMATLLNSRTMDAQTNDE